MAHVVGVPRRDPCRKCQLPVFLAERLLVGKKVYHRTCLKCARCGSQLTPGSFYETEVDDQYCCETCPDEEITATISEGATGDELPLPAVAAAGASGGNDVEETSKVQLRNKLEGEASLSPSTTRSVRSSIRDRLAFFEQKQQPKNREDTIDGDDSKLLQKSLSDEEKSKSLQRMEKSSASSPTYKMNSALTNFLNDTVDNEPDDEVDPDRDEDESESISSSLQNSKMDTTDSEETDDLTSVSLPPELPKSLPPALEIKPEEKKKPEETKRFTASAQLILGSTTTNEADEQHNLIRPPTPQRPTTELQISLSSSVKTNDETNNNNVNDDDAVVDQSTSTDTSSKDIEKTTETLKTIQQIELDNNLASNETNDNDCVTKDKATVDVSMTMETETVAAQQLESTTTLTKSTDEEKESSLEKLETSENVKEQIKEDEDVELRTKSPTAENKTLLTSPGEDKETTQRLSVVRARLQQFEVITNNEKESKTATNAKPEANLNISLTNPTLKTTKEENEPSGDRSRSEEDVLLPPMPTTAPREETVKMETENVTVTIEEPLIPTPAPREETVKMETENVTVTIEEPLIPTPAPREETVKMETENVTKSLEIPNENIEEVEVPLVMETKDNEEILENKQKSIDEMPSTLENDDIKKPEEEKHTKQKENEEKQSSATPSPKDTSTPNETPSKLALEQYPEDLNPFKSDDEEDQAEENKENVVLRKPPIPKQQPAKMIALNPFDSSDDEVELEKSHNSTTSTPKIPPPRPPPPRISRNPFGSEDEEEDEVSGPAQLRRSSLTASQSKRTPVPTPRSNISQSLNPTPEPTPRLSTKITSNNNSINNQHNNTSSTTATTTPHSNSYVLQNSSDFYGSANSLQSNHNNTTTPNNNLLRNSDIRSSNNSLNLSAGGTIRSRKSRRAPLPPAPVKELFPSSETLNTSSKASTPSSSTVGTPKSGRKKRPAPAPPKPARLDPSSVPHIQVDPVATQSKNLLSYPLQSELDSKLSDEEKALLEGKTIQSTECELQLSPASSRRNSKRLIPLDQELLEEHSVINQSQCDDLKQQQNLQKSYQQEESEANVVYRRLLIPHNLDTPTHESNPLLDELNNSSSMTTTMMMGERQLEKLKDNKEANNRNRQSQISAASSGAEDNDPLFNKSVHGKWKRRKGPAPALPIPPRKVLQMLPLQEIKHELDIIEVQQQGLEKQGVILEKMIRDRCEGENGEPLNAAGEVTDTTDGGGQSPLLENSKEVENLILQLFELVNEKNELFRRQAELMYLRRQHRLEQEQADLEYEIRVSMAQPERNKTDSDKAREEALIERLVEVVQLRNEVVECLEMDRIREAEEDQSIKQRLESHIANKRDDEPESKSKSSTSKLSKKEKKKQKESKKLVKNKKLDADKDADESEANLDKQKTKKKKKLLIF